jgi:oxygen-independent coproporphyrinogen-3 oxidase
MYLSKNYGSTTMLTLNSQLSEIGFYFHIPFCPHICPYCDFIKTSNFSKKSVNSFFSELKSQLLYFINLIPNYHHKHVTVYFGGGTPGLFEASYYKEFIDILKQHFIIEECTLETNPYTNIKRKFDSYFQAGFDRITLGAQSICPNTLKFLGRRHTPQDVLKNIQWANHAGFKNIQVDLIYGLKKDTRTITIDDEILTLANIGATGISAYALTIEPRTLFAKTDYANEEVAELEYYQILTACQKIGFNQLETSNFSKFAAKHNNIYWYGKPYIGIGTGAHGLLPATQQNPYGIRYKVGNPSAVTEPGNDKLIFSDESEKIKNFSIIFESTRSKQEYLEEMFFTLLRTPSGIPTSWLKEQIDLKKFMNLLTSHPKIKRALDEQKILISKEFITIASKEKIRGDAWATEFISLI